MNFLGRLKYDFFRIFLNFIEETKFDFIDISGDKIIFKSPSFIEIPSNSPNIFLIRISELSAKNSNLAFQKINYLIFQTLNL